MLNTAQNPYDAVAYPGISCSSAHPDRLAAMAVLHGLSPAPVEHCRVLEIACGDGANLIPIAYAAQSSEFVGFDLAQLPIERGQQRIRDLGLKNARLFQGDLLSLGPERDLERGSFDYIIAHGLYAWVPEPVRDRLLALCGPLLADNGVAFISYNAMPGSYLRSMARDIMLFSTDDAGGPERVVEGLKFLSFLAQERPEGDLYRTLVESQWKRLEKRDSAVTFHDELSGAYRPVYFLDFVKHAQGHGLQYLSDAELPPPPDPCYRAEIHKVIENVAAGDFLKQEQLLDFLRMRTYRETLLCKQDRTVRRDFPPEHFRHLLFASQATSAPGEAPGATAFVLPGGIRMESNHPGVKTLLEELGRVWPRALSFDELEPQLAGQGFVLDAEGATLLVRLAVAKMIELRTWRAPVAEEIADQPRASACSRQEARSARVQATSLLHTAVSLDDAKVRSLLMLLDGTRNRADLLHALRQQFPDASPAELEDGLEPALRLFLRSAILEA